MRRKLFTILVLFAVSGNSFAAGFINSKSDWDGMERVMKRGYVMALLDQHITYLTTDTDTQLKKKSAIAECLSDARIGPDDLIQAVDQKYADDLGSWKHPPYGPFVRAVNSICEL